jgi:hypothetical protein
MQHSGLIRPWDPMIIQSFAGMWATCPRLVLAASESWRRVGVYIRMWREDDDARKRIRTYVVTSWQVHATGRKLPEVFRRGDGAIVRTCCRYWYRLPRRLVAVERGLRVHLYYASKYCSWWSPSQTYKRGACHVNHVTCSIKEQKHNLYMLQNYVANYWRRYARKINETMVS